MRLLTALEDLLGSLGPQITAILSRCLKLEKKREGTCGLILEDENCAAILELTKEKLAGQIVAGKFLLFFITKGSDILTKRSDWIRKPHLFVRFYVSLPLKIFLVWLIDRERHTRLLIGSLMAGIFKVLKRGHLSSNQ